MNDFPLTACKILMALLFITSLVTAQGDEGIGMAPPMDSDSGGHNSPELLTAPPVCNHPPEQPSIETGPISCTPGLTCNYTAYAIDPDGDPLIYIFHWDDGNSSTVGPYESGSEAKGDHIWRQAGTYQVMVKAMDDEDSSPWSSPREVVVNSPPGQPVIPAGRSTVLPGEMAFFATSAEDPDGDRLRYIFDWGDGSSSTTNWTGSGCASSLAHSWQRAGSYEMAARAEDGANASSPWSEVITIIINTLPGRPDQLTGPGSGYAMVPYHFQTLALDADGDSLNYTFDWGDGTTIVLDFMGSGINVSSNHTWTDPGTYQIRAMASDRMGGEWSEERNITIAANEPPDHPRDLYGLRSSYTGIVCNYFTMTRDPDGDEVMHLLNWGDGTITKTGYVPTGSLENASHAWSRSGQFPVQVCSIDEKGAPSAWSGPFMVSISANDPPEQPTMPSGPAAGQASISHMYATMAIDPDGDAVKYVFDWGDGTTTWTGLDYLDSGEESCVSHKWIHPGDYHIKAAALDDKGLISDWSGAIEVKIE